MVEKDSKKTKINIVNNPLTQMRQRRSLALPNMKLKYELLTGLYRKTILGKIVTKFVQISIPTFFTLAIEDEEGNRLPDIERECKPLNEVLNRKLFRDMLKQSLIYGTAFLYIGNINKGTEDLGEVFLLNPWDLQEKVEEGKLIGWEYRQDSSIVSKTVFIPYEDIVTMAHDPDINELYGYSIAEPMAEFLTYFLNAGFDMATILDGFAIPLLLWLVETQDDELADDVVVNKIREILFKQLEMGDDVVLDARIRAEVVNFGKDATKLVELARESRKNLGLVSIPESLLGGESPNLNAIKIHLQMFYADTNDYQAQLNDIIVDRVYKPYLTSKSYELVTDYSNVYINFPPNVLESNSEKIIWIREGLKLGLFDRPLGRLMLGVRGRPPSDEDLEDYLEIIEGRKDTPRGDEARIRDGRDPDNQDENVEDILDKLREYYSDEEIINYIQNN
jgi:hypothetical protein